MDGDKINRINSVLEILKDLHNDLCDNKLNRNESDFKNNIVAIDYLEKLIFKRL